MHTFFQSLYVVVFRKESTIEAFGPFKLSKEAHSFCNKVKEELKPYFEVLPINQNRLMEYVANKPVLIAYWRDNQIYRDKSGPRRGKAYRMHASFGPFQTRNAASRFINAHPDTMEWSVLPLTSTPEMVAEGLEKYLRV